MLNTQTGKYESSSRQYTLKREDMAAIEAGKRMGEMMLRLVAVFRNTLNRATGVAHALFAGAHRV